MSENSVTYKKHQPVFLWNDAMGLNWVLINVELAVFLCFLSQLLTGTITVRRYLKNFSSGYQTTSFPGWNKRDPGNRRVIFTETTHLFSRVFTESRRTFSWAFLARLVAMAFSVLSASLWMKTRLINYRDAPASCMSCSRHWCSKCKVFCWTKGIAYRLNKTNKNRFVNIFLHNAEAMGSNPVKALKFFSGLNLQLLKLRLQLRWSNLYFIISLTITLF